MGARSVITITTGEAGSGKSYARCSRFILDRFLPDHDGPHISNFPLGLVPEDHTEKPTSKGETFADRIAAAAAKMHGMDEHECRERIQQIPAEELEKWEEGTSGPWEYFEGKNLQDAHVAIDEIHNYCDSNADVKLRKRWKQWLGEIRHQGATVEFLSQNLQKVPLEIRREAGLHIEVKNTETERDPFFKILMSDWYELRAILTGYYSSNVMEQERRSAMGQPGKWTDKRLFALDPWYFGFYDSFSKPQKGGNKGKAQKKQFERRSKLGLIWWFVRTNFGRLAGKMLFVAFIIWLAFGHIVGLGGGKWIFATAMDRFQSYGKTVTDEGDEGAQEKSQLVSLRKDAKEERPASIVKTEEAMKEAKEVVKSEKTPDEVKEIVATLRERIKELEGQNNLMSSVIERTSGLVAITKDSITFRNGFEFKTGEVISYGPYEGRTLKRVLWSQRAAKLDDGTILRMGNGGNRSATQRLFDAAKKSVGSGS